MPFKNIKNDKAADDLKEIKERVLADINRQTVDTVEGFKKDLKILVKMGLFDVAAESLEKSAEVYTKAKMFDKAADKFGESAELYVKAGMDHKASELCERTADALSNAGRHSEAANIYENMMGAYVALKMPEKVLEMCGCAIKQYEEAGQPAKAEKLRAKAFRQ